MSGPQIIFQKSQQIIHRQSVFPRLGAVKCTSTLEHLLCIHDDMARDAYMFVCVSVCLFVCLSVSVSVCLPVCLFPLKKF